MENWLVPCNLKFYDIFGAFSTSNKINWKQSIKDIKIGDYVYIYVGCPVKEIKFKCRVNKTNIPYINNINNKFVINGERYCNYKKYMELELVETLNNGLTLEALQNNGLKGNVQGPRRIKEQIMNFINTPNLTS